MPTEDVDQVVRAAVGGLDRLERRALMLIYIGDLARRQPAKRLRDRRIAVAIAVARAFRTQSPSRESGSIARSDCRCSAVARLASVGHGGGCEC